MTKLYSSVACLVFATGVAVDASAQRAAPDAFHGSIGGVLRQQDPRTAEQIREEQRGQEQRREEQRAREQIIKEQREHERRVSAVVPVDVHVVISRYRAEKKVSSLPYSLTVNAVHPAAAVQVAHLRMGAQVPLPAMATPTVDGKPVSGLLTTGPVQYKDIGTAIDASAKALDTGGFELHVSVSDTSLYRRPAGAPPAGAEDMEDTGLPVLRTFSASNNMVLKDGQSKQFMLAADRVSSETLRVEVTLNVVK